jgi:hypothetical protein
LAGVPMSRLLEVVARPEDVRFATGCGSLGRTDLAGGKVLSVLGRKHIEGETLRMLMEDIVEDEKNAKKSINGISINCRLGLNSIEYALTQCFEGPRS